MLLVKKNNIKSLLILFIAVSAIALFVFGSKIFKHTEYIITWPNKSSLIFKSWYLLIGICLFVTHIFTFLREWHHSFKRELMNLIGVIVSVFLLLYSTTAYYGINDLSNSLRLSEKKLLSIEGVHVDTIDNNFLFRIKIVLLLLVAWSFFFFILFLIKVLYALRRHKEL